MKRFHATFLLALFAAVSAHAVETNATLVGDGATLNTVAIQRLIDERSAAGGGTVRLPAGRFVTGTIELKHNVTLELDAQTVLLGSTNVADYRNVDPFTDGSGTSLGHALIVANGVTNVGVTGAGLIDGRGRELKAAQKNYAVRPFLMRWLHCTNVTVKDVRLTNPGAWTMNFFQTRNATIERVTIRTREKRLKNNDGIDLDSCEAVRVCDCDIESGDDALCFKATSKQPCRDIVASGCKLATRCNAIKLGTESIGDFENITVTNCEIRDTEMAGIALYDVDGAQMQHINIGNLTMSNVMVAVSMRLGARLKTFREGDQPRPVGQLRDVNIHDVRATGVKQIGLLINGIPGHCIENLEFENLAITVSGGGSATNALVKLGEHESAYPEFSMFGKTFPAYGAYVRHVRGVNFKNVQFTPTQPDARPATVFIDVEGVTPKDFEKAGAPPH